MIAPNVREWLPPGALAGAAVRATVSKCVEKWAERWFMTGDVSLARIEPMQAGSALPRATSFARALSRGPESNAGNDLQLVLSTDGENLITLHALNRSAGDPVTDADRPLLNSFARRVTDDLMAEFTRLLDMDVERPDHSRQGFAAALRIADSRGRNLLSLNLSPRAAKALIKRSIGSVPSTDVVPLAVACDRAEISVRMRVGGMHLNAQSIRELSIGDVVVLDRLIADGMELVVGDRESAFGRADLTNDEGPPKLLFRSHA
jgi:hypothetical protein